MPRVCCDGKQFQLPQGKNGKMESEHGTKAPNIPPTHRDDSGSYSLVFLSRAECWTLLHSGHVGGKGNAKQTLPWDPFSTWITTVPLIDCCLEENVLCPNFYFMMPLCSYSATFLQRNICRNAGCNRRLWNEKNGDSVSLFGNQDSAQKLNLFWKNLNWFSLPLV